MTKTGWIVVNEFLYTGKFSELTQMFVSAAKKFQIHLEVRTNAEIYTGLFEVDQTVQKPAFVLFWDKDIILAKYLEYEHIPVFNCARAIEICDDKREIYISLQNAGLPIPRTICAPMTYETIGYQHTQFLETFEQALGFPMVVKEAFGSFGEQVYKIENHEQLEKKVRELQRTPFLFQEYLATSEGQDIRMQVVGDRVVAAMRRFSEFDFRANISNGGQMEVYHPDQAACRLAVQACRAVGCDFAGVDLLFGKDGFVVCEVNSNAHFKNLYDCTGVDASEYIMEYIDERTA